MGELERRRVLSGRLTPTLDGPDSVLVRDRCADVVPMVLTGVENRQVLAPVVGLVAVDVVDVLANDVDSCFVENESVLVDVSGAVSERMTGLPESGISVLAMRDSTLPIGGSSHTDGIARSLPTRVVLGAPAAPFGVCIASANAASLHAPLYQFAESA